MGNEKFTPRIVGVLIIMQMFCSGIVNLVMEKPLFIAPGYLVNATTLSQQIGLASLIGLASGLVWIAIAVTSFPVFYQYSRRMSLWLLALSIIVAAITAFENISLMSMLSVSEEYAKASGGQRANIQAIQSVISAPRDWAHFIDRIFAGITNFSFYAVLFRFTLIPRPIAGFGILASILMIIILSMPLFGYDVIFSLLAPMGLSQLVASLWLIIKGFRVTN
jgi:Domain of unknown function (DUF4386)